MFNPGDPLLVDAGVKHCDHDGVYFFRVGNEGYVKRLQRIPNVGIVVMSKNTEYKEWTITPDMDFEVLAKVLKVWQSEKF
jgi:phage repressor protein C with HTH and peptisase S24 domain